MVANRNALKTYAPQARKDFIQAMTNRASLFGITKAGAAVGEERGELFILDGKAFPRSVGKQRKRLIDRIAATSFDQALEAVAYTWFNRFLAIRYMELHGYIDHGYRVLSHPAGEAEPEILQQAQHLTLPGLDLNLVVELKLKGDQDEALYRHILIAQCNDLHRAMPFLFERIEDETELLLPENLLQSDSIIRNLVNQIAESEWDEIEIIGWLYQFYISEKKDQVIGKVVKSEDIPAATQLFTPNWIVKYMVQNSLGAQWLATYPDSPLKAAMAYYIEPVQQTPEVQAQLGAITPRTLDPEAITFIDPAVGSGHILVEAYGLFRAIYIERGYTPQAAAREILTKNLYGLDIDDRAAQMAGFALLMKARADDRTLLSDPPTLNIMSMTDSGDWDASAMADALMPAGQVELLPPTDLLPETIIQKTLSASVEPLGARAAIADIVALFDGAKTFGSLITVPETVKMRLPILEGILTSPASGDLLRRVPEIEARARLAKISKQARLLGNRYDVVVANPPYISNRSGMNDRLKGLARQYFSSSRGDTFAMFIDRASKFAKPGGRISNVTLDSWLNLDTYEDFRRSILENITINSLAHMPYEGKAPTAMGINFGVVCFSAINDRILGNNAYFVKQRFSSLDSNGVPRAVKDFVSAGKWIKTHDFTKAPANAFVFSLPDRGREVLFNSSLLSNALTCREGMATADNDRFVRWWFEVDARSVRLDSLATKRDRPVAPTWFPYNKGGEYRKWFGNNGLVVRWDNDGRDIRANVDPLTNRVRSHNYNGDYGLRPGLTWTSMSSRGFSARFVDAGYLFDAKGPMGFASPGVIKSAISLMNSKVGSFFLSSLSSTKDFKIGHILALPISSAIAGRNLADNVERLVEISREDEDSQETSWNFGGVHLFDHDVHNVKLVDSLSALFSRWNSTISQAISLEELSNVTLIDAYGLNEEITPNVAIEEITLNCNSYYRYGVALPNEERQARLLSDTLRELISHGIGLIMGRYSLVEPGLIYAQAGNEGFDPGRYGHFPVDDDGIVPITEEPWFAEDAATRLEQFLALAWPQAPIGETMATLTDGLTQGKGGEPRSDLRAYLAKTFYKDHLQTYRNRPIYWLFSSGKQKAFECLVYLHRYNESTLARMRTAYVTPLLGKMQQRITDLEAEIAGSASSAEKTRKGRDRDKTAKQLTELRAFDEELRHLADQRIALNLDDGVKVNYGRFGNLLAAKDKVCGKENDKDD